MSEELKKAIRASTWNIKLKKFRLKNMILELSACQKSLDFDEHKLLLEKRALKRSQYRDSFGIKIKKYNSLKSKKCDSL